LPLRDEFSEYIDALVESNRHAEIGPLIEYFAPHWDHNLGYGLLGTAAFKIGKFDLAEAHFLRLRKGMENYCRSEEMSLLAEIWTNRGERDRARDLLVDCLQKLVIMVNESKYASDRKTFEGEFQHHRQTFLRLFADLGEAELQRQNIPPTTGA
jgi:hypothetical protein